MGSGGPCNTVRNYRTILREKQHNTYHLKAIRKLNIYKNTNIKRRMWEV